jgi:cytochrome c oxidase cbb3-type subunit III
LILSVVTAQLPAQQTAVPDRTAIERGRTQFRKSCSFCHGPDATGGTEGPNLTQSSLVRHDKNGDLIGNVIREGRPAKGMPPFALPPAEIADLVAYLHGRIAELDRRSAGRPSATYSLKRLLTGNAEAGKKFYDDSGCAKCHSTTGDLAAIAKKYPPVELQSRFLYPPDAKRIALIRLPSGKELSGELTYLDAFTIAIIDSNGWYHSWPLDSVKVEIHDPLTRHRELLDRYTDTDVHNVFAFLETLK